MDSTRRIVMFNGMTANGYFAGADGNLDWVVPDEQQAKAAVEDIPLFDTILFGRKTYELFEKFWSNALDDSSSAPDPPSQRTNKRSSRHSDLVKRQYKINFLQNFETFNLEKFPHPWRIKPRRDCSYEATA